MSWGDYASNRLIGATNFAVGLSLVTVITPTKGVNGYLIRKQSAGGTLFISGGSLAANIGTGYAVDGSDGVEITGSAQFYLSAAGATPTVGMAILYNSGYSLYPP